MTRTYYRIEYSYMDAWAQCNNESLYFKTEEELELFLEKLLARADIYVYRYEKSKTEIWSVGKEKEN